MSGGTEFHAAPCVKARSPNLVHSRGVTYLLLEADRSIGPTCCCAAGRTDDVF